VTIRLLWVNVFLIITLKKKKFAMFLIKRVVTDTVKRLVIMEDSTREMLEDLLLA
jgi:hypothetical protein